MNDLDRPLTHVVYGTGQLLRAADVRDDEEHEARLWRLHNRYLHETWGIAVGFAATLLPKASAVRIGPGYAIDEDGRDLVLDHHVRMPIPASGKRRRFVLTARSRADEGRAPAGDAEGACGRVRKPRPERPLLAWRTLEETQPGQDVLLAAVAALHGGAQGPLDLGVRQMARTARRPRIATGATEPGHSGWSWWQGPAPGQVLGLTLRVSTEDAGFTSVPAYFARLEADAHGLARKAAFTQGGAIVKATRRYFVYRLVHGTPLGVGVSPEEAEQRGWSVSWTGIERAVEIVARSAS